MNINYTKLYLCMPTKIWNIKLTLGEAQISNSALAGNCSLNNFCVTDQAEKFSPCCLAADYLQLSQELREKRVALKWWWYVNDMKGYCSCSSTTSIEWSNKPTGTCGLSTADSTLRRSTFLTLQRRNVIEKQTVIITIRSIHPRFSAVLRCWLEVQYLFASVPSIP